MPCSHSCLWFGELGHIPVSLVLRVYASGQPCLTLLDDAGSLREELTLEVPGFDLRAYDADFNMQRLHMVFRSPARAELLAGCDLVNLTPFLFTVAASGKPAFQVVWIERPPSWRHIEQGALAT